MPGHVEKRNGGYTIVIDLGTDPLSGKRKRYYYAFKGKKEDAKKELNRLLAELERGMFVEPSKLSFGEYLQKWLIDTKNKTSPRTYYRYKQIVENAIIPNLGMVIIEKLKPLHIQEYYNKMLQSGRADGKPGGLSPTTVLQHHRIIHRALEMAVKWQVVARNVADAVDPPKRAKPELTPLTEDQVATMLRAAVMTPFHGQIVLAVLAGLRRSEIYGLRWQDVNFNAGTITINQSAHYVKDEGIFYKEPKTKKSKRTIDISDYVLATLRKLQNERKLNKMFLGEDYNNDNELIFTQSNGLPQFVDSISSWFPRWMVKQGFPRIRFHDLRHTHASLLLKGGESLKLICDRLGHGGIGITADTYTHLAPGMQKNAAKKLEHMIFGEESGRRLGDENEKEPPE